MKKCHFLTNLFEKVSSCDLIPFYNIFFEYRPDGRLSTFKNLSSIFVILFQYCAVVKKEATFENFRITNFENDVVIIRTFYKYSIISV